MPWILILENVTLIPDSFCQILRTDAFVLSNTDAIVSVGRPTSRSVNIWWTENKRHCLTQCTCLCHLMNPIPITPLISTLTSNILSNWYLFRVNSDCTCQCMLRFLLRIFLFTSDMKPTLISFTRCILKGCTEGTASCNHLAGRCYFLLYLFFSSWRRRGLNSKVEWVSCRYTSLRDRLSTHPVVWLVDEIPDYQRCLG